VDLPRGATPIDFAYVIHTEVGHNTVGARVNNRLVPLSYELVSGDTVELITSASSGGPSRDWLQIVRTPRARNKIRQWFARERREDALAQGRDALVAALRKQGLPVSKIAKSDLLPRIAEELRYADVDALHVAIGEGHLSPQSVTTRVIRLFEPQEPTEEPEDVIATTPPRRRSLRPRDKGVIVEGHDDLLVRLARCCTPVPGDSIVGFMTRGRGVSVHRSDCPNAKVLAQSEGARIIEAWWDQRQSSTFMAAVQIEALDRTKLLRDITSAISDHGLQIVSSSSRSGSDGIATLTFTLELSDPAHLEHVIQTVRRVDAVFDAYRIVPSGARA
jgi:GTP diphosphokinase / guanosine-3',5'-bis(diphosphate) 3'-diphosphatase